MQEHFISGARPDPRPITAQQKDYQHIEVAGAAGPVVWKEKTQSEWRKFPIRNQNGSGTCVAQTGAKILGIENHLEEGRFVDFSANLIYQRRADRNLVGMYGQEALEILSKFGTTTEARWPSQNLTEAQANTPKDLAPEDLEIMDTYRAGGYVMLPIRNIEAVAQVIQSMGKGVMLFFDFEYDEWTDVPQLKHQTGNLYHSVTGVDAFLYDGKKSILIDDSWGRFYGFDGQRVITEDFLKKRNFFAGYVLDLTNKRNERAKPPVRPKHRFDANLQFGMIKNEDVKKLQDILRFEELFPQKIESTGNYLQITAKAVMAFQRKHKVASEADIVSLQGKMVGPKTRKKLNELYA